MELLTRHARRPRKEKPYAVVRLKHCNRTNSFGPKTLVHQSIRSLSDYILTILDDPEQLQELESSGRIQTLPTVMLDMLEKHVTREAELTFSPVKLNQEMYKIWKIFFNPENPTESLRCLNLDQFLDCDHWSYRVFGHLSSATSLQSLNIADLRLRSTLYDATKSSISNFVSNEDIFREKFEKLLKVSQNVEKVHLIGRFFDDDCLHSLAKNGSQKLKILKLSNSGPVFNDEGSLTDEGIVDFVDRILARNLVTLTCVDLSQWYMSSENQITAKGIVYLNKLKSVTEIHFRMSHLTHCDMVESLYKDLIDSGNQIRSVHLYSEHTFFEVDTFIDTMNSVHVHLKKFFPQMSSLHLHSLCSSTRKTCPLLFSTFSSQIKSLDLILAKDLDTWARLLPHLETLSLTEPKLGLNWRSVSLDNLRKFHFDDSSWFLHFDLIVQVTS